MEKEEGGEMKEKGKKVNQDANDEVFGFCIALDSWLVGSGLIAQSVSQRIC